ncbi:MAG: chemotaxis protein CheB, partial [Ktedonobacterales bacterium]
SSFTNWRRAARLASLCGLAGYARTDASAYFAEKELPCMDGHDIIVIGASAGGVEPTVTILRELPQSLPAAVFVVIHIPPHVTSRLLRIFARASRLPAQHAVDGAPIERGHIYVAPPDMHVLLEQGYMRVVRGPKENRTRPAIDPLFRTAARVYGPRVIGVVLSGALNDGTAGLLAIKRRSGLAIVQDPHDAVVAMMPESALDYVSVDHCVPAAQIAPLLNQLTRLGAEDEGAYPVPSDMDFEANIAQPFSGEVHASNRPGKLSAYTCPDCRGPLWEIEDGELLRYRCREGHAFTGDTVLDGQYEAIEVALWTALETLTESALMADHLAQQARGRGHRMIEKRFREKAGAARERAAIIRDVLNKSGAIIPPERPDLTGGARETSASLESSAGA